MWHPGGLSSHTFWTVEWKKEREGCCVLLLQVGKEKRVSFSFFCCKDNTKGFSSSMRERLCHLWPTNTLGDNQCEVEQQQSQILPQTALLPISECQRGRMGSTCVRSILLTCEWLPRGCPNAQETEKASFPKHFNTNRVCVVVGKCKRGRVKPLPLNNCIIFF